MALLTLSLIFRDIFGAYYPYMESWEIRTKEKTFIFIYRYGVRTNVEVEEEK